ncbi:hypothetical protein C0993_004299, partial [Termitomyces sp. T159_Od127]
MPLFKRKEQNLIPPVAQDAPRGASPTPRSPYHSNASTYVASRDGDPYSAPGARPAPHAPAEPQRDKYSRSNGVGDVYSRGAAEIEKDRSELFAGYRPPKPGAGAGAGSGSGSGSGRFFDGPPPGEEGEEDVEGIKQQTRFVKQESV